MFQKVSQRDPEAASIRESRIAPLHNPEAPLAAQFTFITPFRVVRLWRPNQFDPSLRRSPTQRARIVAVLGNHALEGLPQPAMWLGCANSSERGLQNPNLARRGTFHPDSQRRMFTVDQYYPFPSFPASGCDDSQAYFFTGVKLPLTKASSRFRRHSSSNERRRLRHESSHTHSSRHCLSRRQPADGTGNPFGRKQCAFSTCRIHRIPSRQAWLDRKGRARLSECWRRSGVKPSSAPIVRLVSRFRCCLSKSSSRFQESTHKWHVFY